MCFSDAKTFCNNFVPIERQLLSLAANIQRWRKSNICGRLFMSKFSFGVDFGNQYFQLTHSQLIAERLESKARVQLGFGHHTTFDATFAG
jgi:hypothetical protein